MKNLFVNIRGKLLDNKEKVIISICALFVITLIIFNVQNTIKITNLKGEINQKAIDNGFTDKNFYQCVIDNYNNEKETNLTISDDMPSNLSDITYLDCVNRQIEDISGIENLTNLKELNFNKNKIKYMNFNNNKKMQNAIIGNNNIEKIEYDKLDRISFYDTDYEYPTIVIKPFESFDVINNIKGVENIDISSTDKYTYENGIFTNKDDVQMLVLDGSGSTVTVSDFKFLTGNGYDITNYVIDGDNINIFYYDDYYLPGVLSDLRPMFEYKINNNKLEIYDNDSLIKTYNIKGVKMKNTRIVGDHIISTLNYSGNINDYIEYVSDDFTVDNYFVYNKNTGSREYYLVDFINVVINDYQIDDNVIYTGGEKFDTNKITVYNNRGSDTGSNDITNLDLTNEVNITMKDNTLSISAVIWTFFDIQFIEDKKKVEHNVDIKIEGNGLVNSNLKSAKEGTDINLEINPSENYELDYIKILDENNNDVTDKVKYNKDKNSFIMPDYDVIVSAKFKKKITTTSKTTTKEKTNESTTRYSSQSTKEKTTKETIVTTITTTVKEKTTNNTTTSIVNKTNKVASKNNKSNIKNNTCYYYDISITLLIILDIILVSIVMYRVCNENKG